MGFKHQKKHDLPRKPITGEEALGADMQEISTWMWLVLGRYSIAMHVRSKAVDLPSDA